MLPQQPCTKRSALVHKPGQALPNKLTILFAIISRHYKGEILLPACTPVWSSFRQHETLPQAAGDSPTPGSGDALLRVAVEINWISKKHGTEIPALGLRAAVTLQPDVP